ncbi:phosphopantothenoylcysteine decarboxylase, partial [Streptomyces sp. SID7760]|nr:phosphopantothenoylcysteine decarboxylase [Streptomyces sp. SID7760]
AVLKAAADADAVVMAAAVADFRPAEYASGKIKKKDGEDPAPVALVRNPDVLAEISAERAREGQVVVGFAAETDDVLANGRAKLLRKGCDLLVVNEVGETKTFGSEENEAVILASDGTELPVPYGPKEALAEVLWDRIAPRLAPRRA